MSDNEQFIVVENKVIKEKVLMNLQNYHQNMKFMAADAPIEVLCLPKVIETILLNEGCIRIYDILNRDLAEIKGLGIKRSGDLTSRLNEFFAMC